MTGISALTSAGGSAATDRTTVVISRALQEKQKEAEAMVRLIEAASAYGKGQHVNYHA